MLIIVGLVLSLVLPWLAQSTNWLQVRERVDVKQLLSACLEAVEAGGREVVRVRGLHDIGERSKETSVTSKSENTKILRSF